MLESRAIATEAHEAKTELIQELARKHRYDPWRIRIFDVQRAGVHLENPPPELLPADLRARFFTATTVWQANGFAFTSSETSSVGQVATPYRAVAAPCHGGRSRIALTYDHQPVADLDELHLVELMGRPSVFYFAFKDAAGAPLHTYLILNPYESCAYRCRYCSRLPWFGAASHDHRANLAHAVREVRSLVASPEDVRFVNIITGSQASAEGDVAMFRDVIEAFRLAGFACCEFGVYTANVYSRAQMEDLRRMGVVFFTVTVESTTDEARARLHEPRNPKRTSSLADVIHVLEEAERIFPYVNTTMMLGYEPADALKENLARIAQATHATVNHYIPRIWFRSQHELLHEEAGALEYYVDMSAYIEREINAGRRSVGAFFAERFGIVPFQLRYRS